MSLSNKQARFVEEYLVDFNATQAAIRAGYSQKTAYSIGWENLRKPEIIVALREKAMSAEEVLMRLSDIARGDIADVLDIHSTGYSLALQTKDDQGNVIVNPQTKLIKKLKQKTTTILSNREGGDDREIVETEIELYSALEALGMLGKYHKLFIDRTELTGAGGGAMQAEVTIKDESILRKLFPELATGDADGADQPADAG